MVWICLVWMSLNVIKTVPRARPILKSISRRIREFRKFYYYFCDPIGLLEKKLYSFRECPAVAKCISRHVSGDVNRDSRILVWKQLKSKIARETLAQRSRVGACEKCVNLHRRWSVFTRDETEREGEREKRKGIIRIRHRWYKVYKACS